jgi:hypothetical protein
MTIARAGASHDHVVHRVVVSAHRHNQLKMGSSTEVPKILCIFHSSLFATELRVSYWFIYANLFLRLCWRVAVDKSYV